MKKINDDDRIPNIKKPEAVGKRIKWIKKEKEKNKVRKLKQNLINKILSEVEEEKKNTTKTTVKLLIRKPEEEQSVLSSTLQHKKPARLPFKAEVTKEERKIGTVEESFTTPQFKHTFQAPRKAFVGGNELKGGSYGTLCDCCRCDVGPGSDGRDTNIKRNNTSHAAASVASQLDYVTQSVEVGGIKKLPGDGKGNKESPRENYSENKTKAWQAENIKKNGTVGGKERFNKESLVCRESCHTQQSYLDLCGSRLSDKTNIFSLLQKEVCKGINKATYYRCVCDWGIVDGRASLDGKDDKNNVIRKKKIKYDKFIKKNSNATIKTTSTEHGDAHNEEKNRIKSSHNNTKTEVSRNMAANIESKSTFEVMGILGVIFATKREALRVLKIKGFERDEGGGYVLVVQEAGKLRVIDARVTAVEWPSPQTSIDLSNNELTSVDSFFFEDLFGVISINLSRNQISTISSDAFYSSRDDAADAEKFQINDSVSADSGKTNFSSNFKKQSLKKNKKSIKKAEVNVDGENFVIDYRNVTISHDGKNKNGKKSDKIEITKNKLIHKQHKGLPQKNQPKVMAFFSQTPQGFSLQQKIKALKKQFPRQTKHKEDQKNKRKRKLKVAIDESDAFVRQTWNVVQEGMKLTSNFDRVKNDNGVSMRTLTTTRGEQNKFESEDTNVPKGELMRAEKPNISSNQQKCSKAKSFVWKSLERLDLSHNSLSHIESLIPNTPLKHLKRLYLSHNKISSISALFLHHFASLQLLDISDNSIGTLGASLLSHASLQSVYSANNDMASLTGVSFDHERRRVLLCGEPLSPMQGWVCFVICGFTLNEI